VVRFALLVALVAVPVALASHPDGPYETRRANLDQDRAVEQAVGWQSSDIGHTTIAWWVEIENACRGRKAKYRVSGKRRTLDVFRTPEADGATKRREVFYVLRDSVGQGETAIVRLTRRRSCPAPRYLFRYVTHFDVIRFTVGLSDFDRSKRGLEVRLFEDMLGDADTTRYYAYDPRTERYLLYRTTQA
jgi:hypothetical protein